MEKRPRENWKEVQNTYLHTIGNWTLTRYNSEMSDKPFKVKRDMQDGFADSPLRLNSGLGQLQTWNEQEIINRAKILAEKAIMVWEYPNLAEETISQYKKKINENETETYTIEDFPDLTGEMLDLFEQLRKRTCNLDSSVRVRLNMLFS